MSTELTDQQRFHSLAEDYSVKKKISVMNILECGKILYNAKQSITHGMFSVFLSDPRVNESERTAQRLIAIYKDYRHLLEGNSSRKIDTIIELGISHLLELRKLPDRFKKEIEVIDVDGDAKIEKVIDEEKLADFLEEKVEVQGEMKSVKDLPLTEMKKYINEARGLFEPDSYDYDPVEGPDAEQRKETVVAEQKSKALPLIKLLEEYNIFCLDLIKRLPEITYEDVISEDGKVRVNLKRELNQAISHSQAIVLKAEGLKETL
jgi:hypothetical protein